MVSSPINQNKTKQKIVFLICLILITTLKEGDCLFHLISSSDKTFYKNSKMYFLYFRFKNSNAFITKKSFSLKHFILIKNSFRVYPLNLLWIPTNFVVTLHACFFFHVFHYQNTLFLKTLQKLHFIVTQVFYFKIIFFYILASKEAKETEISGNIHVFYYSLL